MPVDAVLFARSGPATGWLATVAAEFAPGLGPVVAVLRRRFPGHVAAVATAVSGLSLVSTALVAALGQWLPPQPSGAEALAIALVVGSACHRLRPRPAFAQAVLGGVATVLGSPTALFAAAAAVAWGAALAVGLLLRDADARAGAAAAEVRTAERLRLTRELHDLVEHQITGIVVRAQAAHRVAQRQGGDRARLIAVESGHG